MTPAVTISRRGTSFEVLVSRLGRVVKSYQERDIGKALEHFCREYRVCVEIGGGE